MKFFKNNKISLWRFFCRLLVLICPLVSMASIYTWNGGTTGNWETPGSWKIGSATATVAPTSTDIVSIASGQVNFANGGNAYTVAGLTMSGGTLNLGTNTLTITGTTTFTGGTVNGTTTLAVTGGSFSISNATLAVPLTIGTSTVPITNTTFASNSVLSGVVTIWSQAVYFNGGTFSQDVTAVVSGTGAMNQYGHNQFNGTFTLTYSGSGTINFAYTLGDTFNGLATINNTNTGTISLATNALSTFNQGLSLNHQGTSGTIYLAQGSVALQNTVLAKVYGDITVGSTSTSVTGSKLLTLGWYGAVQQYDGTVLVASSGFHNGSLNLGRFSQIYTGTSQALNIALDPPSSSGSASLTAVLCNIPGGATLSAPMVSNIQQNTFGPPVQTPLVSPPPNIFIQITDNGYSPSTARTWYGGNALNGKATIVNEGGAILYMANSSGDYFYGACTVTAEANSTGTTHLAYNAASTFSSGLTLDNRGTASVLWVGRTNLGSTPATPPLMATVTGDIVLKASGGSSTTAMTKMTVLGDYGSISQQDGRW